MHTTMTYDFFVDEIDKVKILEFILRETDLKFFDNYSPAVARILRVTIIEKPSGRSPQTPSKPLNFSPFPSKFPADLQPE